MKKLLFLTIALLTLVFIMPKEEIKAFEKQSIEIEKADVINIDGVELQAALVIHSINVVEVGIMPGYSTQGVYYSEFSKNSNISNDDTYAFNVNDSSIETSKLYGTNYFLYDLTQNNYYTSTNTCRVAKKLKIYKGVGISTTVIRDLHI